MEKNMIAEKFRTILERRMALHLEDDIQTEQCWKEEIEILSQNIEETILFLEKDCTADEFSWMSEIFEEIVEKTQSREFINCLYRVAEKFPEEAEKYHIVKNIKFAEKFLVDKEV